MRSLIEGLPPEIAKRVHPDWRKNETEYWTQRNTLLGQYADQWIGFAEGRVIVSGTSPVEVFHAAQASGKHPFVTRVGHPNEPLPVMSVEFRRQFSRPGLVLEKVIPDTGADASAIPWSDCERLALDPGDGIPGLMGGVGESSIPTIIFQAWVHLDGADFPCRLQADFTGQERIVGRDVLNGLDILFRGPAREVVINP